MEAPFLLTKKRYLTVIGYFALFLLLAMSAAPFIGPTDIDIWGALFGESSLSGNIDANIFFVIRLPRILLAAVVGAGLAIAGATFQAILRNDLAAPITLGVSGGASLGAVIAIRLGLAVTFFGFTSIALCAFVGASFALAIVFSLVRIRDREYPTSYLLLAGVTVNFFFASLVMLVHYLSNITQSFEIVHWLMGSVEITEYGTLLSTAPLVLGGTGVLIFIARDLNLVSAGAEPAMSRGVNVVRIQLTGLLTAAMITSVVVSVSGPIGFVGLIVPHIVRLIIGPDHRLLIPASFLFGAGFMILCDTCARTVLAPTEIPVGVITALIGGPFFFWMLTKQQRSL